MKLDRKNRRLIDKVLKKRKANETLAERSERIKKSIENGKRLHEMTLKANADSELKRTNPQMND